MRVGMRLGQTSCHAVVLDGRLVVHRIAEVQRGTLAEAIDTAFTELSETFGNRISDVTIDVAEILEGWKLAQVIAIRISPRPPADAVHAIGLPERLAPFVSRTVHVRGGHDLRAHELAPLDEESLIGRLPEILAGNVKNVAITSVGSTATTKHETAIADAILSFDSDLKISISHDFYSNVFRDRDFTTILNSALMDAGEYMETMVDEIARLRLPAATISYMKNDAGRAPLSRLSVTPVHGLHPRWPARVLGAAVLAGVTEGDVVVRLDSEARVGRVRSGLPIARTLIRRGYGASLATNAAVVEQYSPSQLTWPRDASVVHELRGSSSLSLDDLLPTLTTREDTALVGCASAPLTEWIDRLEMVANETELNRLQHLAEEDAQSLVMQSGASPDLIKIVESSVFAMPYGNPGIVRIRVQAAGEPAPSDDEMFGLKASA